MYKKRSKNDPKPKRIYKEREMTKDDWEKANKDYFGENNADWLSEKNDNSDRFEDDEGPKELDFDY